MTHFSDNDPTENAISTSPILIGSLLVRYILSIHSICDGGYVVHEPWLIAKM